jgi:hypothetical protein
MIPPASPKIASQSMAATVAMIVARKPISS